MSNKIKKIGVLTSGGDSPGMNAAVRAVVRTAAYYGIESFGIKNGYNGLINGELIPLGPRDVKYIINKGGTFLKSARSKEFRTKQGREKAFETCNKFGLDAIVIIGGDGSFTGATIFQDEFDFPMIGIPGTIDNDIYGTDFTLGYDTALNTIIESVDKIRDTATSHNRVFFVEVMGRNAGILALTSGIASGAQEILIPEVSDTYKSLFESLEKSHNNGRSSSIVIVSEGEKLGNVYDLAKATQEKFPKYDIRVTVLGHIQRGGAPSCFDRVLASRLGVAALEQLLEGKSNVMVGVQANKIALTPFKKGIEKHNIISEELIKVSKILKT